MDDTQDVCVIAVEIIDRAGGKISRVRLSRDLSKKELLGRGLDVGDVVRKLVDDGLVVVHKINNQIYLKGSRAFLEAEAEFKGGVDEKDLGIECRGPGQVPDFKHFAIVEFEPFSTGCTSKYFYYEAQSTWEHGIKLRIQHSVRFVAMKVIPAMGVGLKTSVDYTWPESS